MLAICSFFRSAYSTASKASGMTVAKLSKRYYHTCAVFLLSTAALVAMPLCSVTAKGEGGNIQAASAAGQREITGAKADADSRLTMEELIQKKQVDTQTPKIKFALRDTGYGPEDLQASYEITGNLLTREMNEQKAIRLMAKAELEQNRLEIQRVQEEEKRRQEEERKKQEEAERAKAAKAAVGFAYSEKDYEVLLRIVQAEAGICDDKGKILVANVILNRVRDAEFPDSITEVVFQPEQFSPVRDGSFNSCVVTEQTKDCVRRAMSGEDYSQGALYFMNRTGARSRSVTWFDSNLTFLFQHQGHEFFR